MAVCLLGETEYDKSFSNFGRSRSSEDISSTLFNEEIATLIFHARNNFNRRGAIRKRAMHSNPEKRLSVVNIPNEFSEHELCCKDYDERRPSLMISPNCQKHSKNSLLICGVKNIWQSMKKECEKEEDKKKNRKSRNSEKKNSTVEDPLQIITNKINETALTITSAYKPTNWLQETSWIDVVKEREKFTKIECDKQAAIWELIETEANCLKFFTIVVEIFLPVFNDIQWLDEELNQLNKSELFGNVKELYNNHIELYNNYIIKPLLKSKIDNQALDESLMKQGFLSISSLLEGYRLFMPMHGKMSKTFTDLEKSNIYMREYIKWTKSYSKSYRDGILSIFSSPIQRITKYKLLLERIKEFSNESERVNLDEMINSVHDFMKYIDSIVIGDTKLDEIKSKITGTCLLKLDVVNIFEFMEKKFINFDVTKALNDFPERVLIHDGRLKLQVDKSKAIEVHCYLFNDMFMVCKPFKKDWSKLFIYKSPIRLDKFFVKVGRENLFVGIIFNDFMIVSRVLMFIGASDEVKLWLDKCNKARTAFINKYKFSLKIPLNFSTQSSVVPISTQNSQMSSEISEKESVSCESKKSGRSESDCILNSGTEMNKRLESESLLNDITMKGQRSESDCIHNDYTKKNLVQECDSMFNDDSEKSQRPESDCVSEYSNYESIDKQLSHDEGYLENEHNSEIIDNFLSLKKNSSFDIEI